MSDYHTFDQYIQVDEESYNIYHQGLKQMIHSKGGDDVIQLISLSYFKQFDSVPQRRISQTLAENYGGNSFRASFSEELKLSPTLLQKYTQQKKFFSLDLSHSLRRSPNSKRKQVLKEVATGMISQGNNVLFTFIYILVCKKSNPHKNPSMTCKFRSLHI